MNTFTLNSHRTTEINLVRLSIIAITIMSFTSHFFVSVFSYGFYLVTLAFFCTAFVLSKPIRLQFDKFVFLFMITFCMIVFSFLRSSRQTGAAFDMAVLLLGMLIVFFPAQNAKAYKLVFNVILIFSCFYACGIFIQLLLPSLFSALLSFFPEKLSEAIENGGGYSGNYNGFTTNVGFAAGFISTGIVALIARKDIVSRANKVIGGAILFISLLFTGKRGTTFFLVLAIVLCYLFSVKNVEKLKRYMKVFFVSVVVLVFVVAFSEQLMRIPFFYRMIESLEGLKGGVDITSSRSRLFEWAIQLFKENPVLGIGWGGFSTTVVGNVTVRKELDVHNIYLQLLCETGLVGALCIFTLFAVVWNAIRVAYRRCLYGKNVEKNKQWQSLLMFAFYYQTFFLLYGITGNPLFDYNHQIMYMISCSIFMGYRCSCRFIEDKAVLQNK